LESAKSSKADMVEVMPGVVPKVIERPKNELSAFVVAGGLIETQEEIEDAINAGATAISIGKQEFWK
jgi:glycerol uptake operon antiterminator